MNAAHLLSHCVFKQIKNTLAMQGRLPEIEALQKQISQAHEEMSDLQFRRNEELAAATAKEQQLVAAKVQLEGQVSALKTQAARLEREAAAAVTRASQHEKQLEELYEHCQSLQGMQLIW